MAQNAYPTALANSLSLPDWVANLQVMFTKGFEQSFEDREDSASMFYIERRRGGGQGDSDRIEEPLSGRAYAKKTDEGDDFNVNVIAPGYYKNVTASRRTVSLSMTWHFQHHNKYPDQILGFYRDLGLSLRERMELDMQLPFGFGTATTYTDMDGATVDIAAGDALALWSTVHTLTNSTTTYRARLANNPQVSDGAVEAGMTLFHQNQYTNNGILIPGSPDTLVTTRDQVSYHVAMKIVDSMSPRSEAHAGVLNPLKGRLRVMRLMRWDCTAAGVPDSTKVKQWMLVDSSQKVGEILITEDPNVTLPTAANGGVTFENENKTLKGSACYEIAILNPRFAVYSSGDGTA